MINPIPSSNFPQFIGTSDFLRRECSWLFRDSFRGSNNAGEPYKALTQHLRHEPQGGCHLWPCKALQPTFRTGLRIFMNIRRHKIPYKVCQVVEADADVPP